MTMSRASLTFILILILFGVVGSLCGLVFGQQAPCEWRLNAMQRNALERLVSRKSDLDSRKNELDEAAAKLTADSAEVIAMIESQLAIPENTRGHWMFDPARGVLVEVKPGLHRGPEASSLPTGVKRP
jgi:hypothetical protein